MNHLFRELAPITEDAWEQIEDEASRSLKHFLAGRKLVDLSGPHGWELSDLTTGRVHRLDEAPHEGTEAAKREVLPLVEVRTPFTLSRRALLAADRGDEEIDLDAVVEAGRKAAAAEDSAIFHGYPAGGIVGMAEASPHTPVDISDDYADYPKHVAAAVATLRMAGVNGPYAIALGPRCYQGVLQSTELGGYPVFDHLREMLGGPIVWAPAVDGAVVLSQRGGDAEITVGEDFAVGFTSVDGDDVHLYLEESFTFRVLGSEAAVHLRYP